MATVEVRELTHRYGRKTALSGVDLTVEEGSLLALIGPNGSGKTTLLQILAGLRRATAGSVKLFGRDVGELEREERARVGYVAEGQRLPGWMRVRELEQYLAPLYPGWDGALADELRRRFRLDPAQRIRTLSRGEHMKAALLCALAPRPRLVLMDEPFTGMDVLTRDDLVRGLLETAGSDGWTVVLCTHDIAEIEALADHVGFLDRGRLTVSESMESLLGRFRRVEVVLDEAASIPSTHPSGWLHVSRTGSRVSFLTATGDELEEYRLRQHFGGMRRHSVHPATLREIFVALANTNGEARMQEAAR